MREMMKNKEKWNIVIIFILLFVSYAIVIESPLNHFSKGGNVTDTDSGVFRYIAYAMQRGALPYVDSFDHKGPLIYLLNYFANFIHPWYGIWFVELCFMFISISFMYKIIRLNCNKVVSIGVLLLATTLLFEFFQEGNYTEEYAMAFISVSLYIFLDYFLNDYITRFRLIVCGFSCASVLMLRANMLSVWIVFCVAVIVRCIYEKKQKELVKFTSWFLVGVIAVVLPISIWLISEGAFGEFVQCYLSFNMRYSFPMDSCGRASMLSQRIRAVFEFANNKFIIISISVMIYTAVKKKTLVNISYIVYIFINLILTAMSGRTFGHYAMTLVPMVVFPLSIIGGLCKNDNESSGIIKIYLALCVFSITTIPLWIERTNDILLKFELRNTDHASVTMTDICNVIQTNSTKEDKITVYGNWDIVYVVADRMSASKYSYQFPIGTIDEQIMDDYFAELEKVVPKIIVIQDGYLDENIENFIEEYDYELLWEWSWRGEVEDAAKIYKLN